MVESPSNYLVTDLIFSKYGSQMPKLEDNEWIIGIVIELNVSRVQLHRKDLTVCRIGCSKIGVKKANTNYLDR